MTVRRLASILVLAACHILGGCATVENYCDQRPAVCAGAGFVAGTAVLIVAVHKIEPPSVDTHRTLDPR